MRQPSALDLLDSLAAAASPQPGPDMLRVDRRQMLGASIAALLAITLGSGATRALAADARRLSPKFAPFLTAMADTIIPDTDTPGAVKAGCPQAMARFISTILKQDEYDKLIAGSDQLMAELTARGGAPFETLAPARRTTILKAFDAEMMAPAPSPPAAAKPGSPPPPTPTPPANLKAVELKPAYTRLRGLVVFTYYTSEIGGSQELRYELVPGRFDADIPHDPKQRAYSNAG